ncbi:hypothetical protein B0H14DRAFT_2594659 [Mycena olivaceomarginata]|nr:hypothetical protein B0H14DRAFT_2594659 [Mycena olivaceomarginata]
MQPTQRLDADTRTLCGAKMPLLHAKQYSREPTQGCKDDDDDPLSTTSPSAQRRYRALGRDRATGDVSPLPGSPIAAPLVPALQTSNVGGRSPLLPTTTTSRRATLLSLGGLIRLSSITSTLGASDPFSMESECGSNVPGMWSDVWSSSELVARRHWERFGRRVLGLLDDFKQVKAVDYHPLYLGPGVRHVGELHCLAGPYYLPFVLPQVPRNFLNKIHILSQIIQRESGKI